MCRGLVDLSSSQKTKRNENPQARIFCSEQCSRFKFAVDMNGLEVNISPHGGGKLQIHDTTTQEKDETRRFWRRPSIGKPTIMQDTKQKQSTTTWKASDLPSSVQEWLQRCHLEACIPILEEKQYHSILHIMLVGLTLEDMHYLGLVEHEKLCKALFSESQKLHEKYQYVIRNAVQD